MRLDSLVGKTLPQYEVISDPTRPSDTAVGIEIEIENINHRNYEGLHHWNAIHEGSIQQGTEFVSHPVWGTAITSALEEVQGVFDAESPYVSFRTSVHVHLNVLDMDTDQLSRLILLYPLYEPALFRLHQSWGRYDNIFCVPIRKSTAIQSGYAHLLRDLENNQLAGNYVAYKYSALNPNSIAIFGTLEFRHMGGTTDTQEISKWINILLRMKEAVMLDLSPRTDPDEIFGAWHRDLEVLPSDIEAGLEIEDYILTLKEAL